MVSEPKVQRVFDQIRTVAGFGFLQTSHTTATLFTILSIS